MFYPLLVVRFLYPPIYRMSVTWIGFLFPRCLINWVLVMEDYSDVEEDAFEAESEAKELLGTQEDPS